MSKGRILELDGLRGIAILLVVSFHYINNQLVNAVQPVGRILAGLSSFGWAGVDLFFILSGFLIGSILLRTRESSGYYRTFYTRRIVRIVPNYYLLLIVYFSIVFSGLFRHNYFLTGNQEIPVWSYFLMLHNVFMGLNRNMGNDSISITWSIGIEEQFYLVVPFLLRKVRLTMIPWILFVIIVLAVFFRSLYAHWIPAYVYLFCRMDALAVGMLMAFLFTGGKIDSFLKDGKIWIIAVNVAAIFLAAFLFFKYRDLGLWRNTILSVFFATAVLFALKSGNSVYKRMLRTKALVWVGTISYSLYLFHFLILGLFYELAGRGQAGIGIYTTRDIGLSLAAFVSSLVIAWVVYRFLETPCVNWGKKFSY